MRPSDGAIGIPRALTTLLVGVAVTFAILGGLLERLELQALNAQFDLRGPRTPRTPIVIVSIDEDSFDELKLQWPWPRALHGAFLDVVSTGRPAAIGLDILFGEPSLRGPEDDQALAEAVARAGNVVLAAVLTVVQESFFTKRDLSVPLEPLPDRAAGVGVVNLPIDRDAFIRQGVLGISHQGRMVPGFTPLLYRLGARAGIPAARLPATEPFLINYRGGPRTFATVPFYQILRGEVPPETFRGKIVLVGATSRVLRDLYPTPFATEGMPGIEIQANLLETLFQGIWLVRLPRWGAVGLAFAAAGFAVWMTRRARPLPALAWVVGTGAVHAGAAFAAFALGNRWTDQVAPPLALLLGYGVTVVENFALERRQKERLARFFSPAVAGVVSRHHAPLGRSRRLVTVLFSDIRGFTTISERLPPEPVVELLEEYMTSMTEAVFNQGGTVTQFVGDQIVALYNAPFDQPDHAARAVRTALDILTRVRGLSTRWEARYGVTLRNGVGINTGEAVVGILGAAQRLEYGAIGDAINIGARLEGLTRDFGTPIIIGEPTYRAVGHLFPCRPLGEVAVKGKVVPVRIYALDSEGQRRAPRAAVEAPLAITLVKGDLRVTVKATVRDLSRSGLRAGDVPAALAASQFLELRLDLPGLPHALSGEGRVAWAAGDQAGIEFVAMSPEDQGLLEAFLKDVNAGSSDPIGSPGPTVPA